MREKLDKLVWKRGKELGRGGFAFVSLVELDKKTSDSYGVPPLMAVKSANVSRSRSLRKEKEFLRQLENCPNVVRCFGSNFTLENRVRLCNLLLEFASGGSLADRIQGLCERGLFMDEIEVKRRAKSVLVGLSYIHKNRIVHCDVKPHNILLMEDDESKIADFGLAKRVGKDDEKDGRMSRCRIRGTALYVAPESADGKYEPPCDIWALGCTVLEMFTGKPPWDYDKTTSVWNILFRIASTDEIPEIPGWVSKDAKDFLGKCFVKDPKYRWTADMLLQHPFITSLSTVEHQAERVKEGRNTADIASKAANSVSAAAAVDDDYILKPFAIMSNYAMQPHRYINMGSADILRCGNIDSGYADILWLSESTIRSTDGAEAAVGWDWISQCLLTVDELPKDPKPYAIMEKYACDEFIPLSTIYSQCKKRRRTVEEEIDDITLEQYSTSYGILPFRNCWKVQRTQEALGPRNVAPLLGF